MDIYYNVRMHGFGIIRFFLRGEVSRIQNVFCILISFDRNEKTYIACEIKSAMRDMMHTQNNIFYIIK